MLAVGFIAIDQYVLDDEAPITVVEAARGDNEGSFEIAASPASLGESAEIQRNAFDVGSTIPMGATAAIEAEPTISRDGRRLVFAANLGDGIQLHSRLLADFDSLPVPGTEVSRLPFMSPDGLWVGFGSGMASGLSKVSVLGGRPQTLTDEIGLFYGGSWGDDDTIIFSTSGDGGAYLARISAAGGRPERLTTPEDGTSHRWPEIPARRAGYLIHNYWANALASDGSIAILSLETNEYRTLIPNAFNARYAPTGHIIFARENGLWGVPFELEGLGTVGTAVPLIDGIQLNTQSGHAPYGLSDDGALVYVRGGIDLALMDGTCCGLIGPDKSLL